MGLAAAITLRDSDAPGGEAAVVARGGFAGEVTASRAGEESYAGLRIQA